MHEAHWSTARAFANGGEIGVAVERDLALPLIVKTGGAAMGMSGSGSAVVSGTVVVSITREQWETLAWLWGGAAAGWEISGRVTDNPWVTLLILCLVGYVATQIPDTPWARRVLAALADAFRPPRN
jgi:hypothetical protein